MKVGTPYTADELLKKAVRYKGYWGKEGGITVSGGEPMLQIDFLTELFRKAKARASTPHWIPAATLLPERVSVLRRSENFWK